MASGYESAVEAVSVRLEQKGVQHSLRVADTAGWLAGLYGDAVENARIAGVLHDWCRDVPGPELVRLADEAGVPVTAVDREVPYLLHGPVAAALLAVEFPWLSQKVLDAVAAHTCGSARIDALGMIVYIADTIEPGRTHDGVDELRRAAGEVSLDELFLRTYAASLKHLVLGRRPIHPTTVETWNALVAGDAHE